METKALLALAEKIAAGLAAMSDDELREAARKMVAPFMHELALRGREYTLTACEFGPKTDLH